MEKDNKDYDSKIKKEQAYYGFNEPEPLLVDDELIELNHDISNNKEIITSWNYIPETANKWLVKHSIVLWEKLGINLHKVNVIYNRIRLEKLKNNEITDAYIKVLSPKKIPVIFNPPSDICPRAGYVIQLLCNDTLDEEKKVVSFHSICLNTLGNYLSICCYNHEIAHTQINSIYGSCKNKLNWEVISALIEEIFVNCLDPSSYRARIRRNTSLLSVSRNIYNLYQEPVSYDEKIELSMYIQSYLEAYNLANIYILGNSNIKIEMCKYINDIFNGNKTVEDMLVYYDSEYKNVPKKLDLIRKTLN